MTRDEALQLVPDRNLIASLEALGVVKFEAPPEPTHLIPALSFLQKGCKVSALVREDTLIETLRQAGFTVLRKGDDQHQAAEIALRECRTMVMGRYNPQMHYEGALGANGAAAVIDFLRTKGFRFIRCAS